MNVQFHTFVDKTKLQNTDALFEFQETTMLQAFIIVYTDPRILIMC